MRKTKDEKKGALAAKQSAILFICAVICVCCIAAAVVLVSNGNRDPVNLQETQNSTGVPEVTDLPAASPSETEAGPSPEPVDTPAPVIETPEPTDAIEEAVMANPMDDMSIQEQSKEAALDGEPIRLPFSGLVIGIDPGHQAKGNYEQEPVAPGSSETKAKVSSGTQGKASGVPEYVTNLEVSLILRGALESLGAEVHMSRTEHDVDVSNIQRALMFNEANADLVLRIHCNGSSNENAEGIGLYVTETGSIAEESYEIAKVILDAMVTETGAEKDGVFRRDTYSGLNWSEVPSMIVEMGFMSNYEEDMKLQDPEYQKKLADGMVKGIAEYYGRDILTGN